MDTQSLKAFLKDKFVQKESDDVSVLTDGLGWLRFSVKSALFDGKNDESRVAMVADFFKSAGWNLNDYPIAAFELCGSMENLPERQKTMPFWSDVLWEPKDNANSKKEAVVDPIAQVVTFYSFKGGVGRSTALTMTASLLAAQNYRVAIIDLDLEAPGVTFFLSADAEDTGVDGQGVVDYLYSRVLIPETSTPGVADIIVPLKYKGPGHGDVFLVPAGRFDENYVHKLSELSWRKLYQITPNPVQKLIRDLTRELEADIILIDARTGFADEGAVSMLELADLCIICLSPTTQNTRGLDLVLKTVLKQQENTGRPSCKFLLTPVGPVGETLRTKWMTEFEDWLSRYTVLGIGELMSEVYCTVSYNPILLTLESVLHPPAEISASYQPLVEFIANGLPAKNTIASAPTVELDIPTHRDVILAELQSEGLPSAAQDLNADKIPSLFQRTGDFSKFLKPTTWLALGAKGTGKSLLFRLFIERPTEAQKLAGSDTLSNIRFLPAHGKSTASAIILAKSDVDSYSAMLTGESKKWSNFWINYAYCALVFGLKNDMSQLYEKELRECEGQNSSISHERLIDLLVSWARDPRRPARVSDGLRQISSYLQETKSNIWLVYDELDVLFDFSEREPALSALLEWWLESGVEFHGISPKILLRKDIWERLGFTNKSHYFSKLISLAWQEEDLLRLALRRVMLASGTLLRIISSRFGANLDNIDGLPLGQLREATRPLWGLRMGKGQKAYSYNWVRSRISDAKGDAFPRSLALLLENAIDKERAFRQAYGDESIIRPKALFDSLDEVSAQRVAEVKAEYPELVRELDLLNSERSPVESNRLGQLWELGGQMLQEKIQAIVQAGVFEDRTPKESLEGKVYATAELYLYGLGMRRKGQK